MTAVVDGNSIQNYRALLFVVTLSRPLSDGETVVVRSQENTASPGTSSGDPLALWFQTRIAPEAENIVYDFKAIFTPAGGGTTVLSPVLNIQEISPANVSLSSILPPYAIITGYSNLKVETSTGVFADVSDGGTAVSATGKIKFTVTIDRELSSYQSIQYSVYNVDFENSFIENAIVNSDAGQDPNLLSFDTEFNLLTYDQASAFNPYPNGVANYDWRARVNPLTMVFHILAPNRSGHENSLGPSFTITLQKQAPVVAPTYDLPFTNGMVMLLDARTGNGLDTTTVPPVWNDMVGSPTATVQMSGQAYGQSIVRQATTPRFKVPSARCLVPSGSIDLGKLDSSNANGGFQLPPDWTMLVIGHPNTDWTSKTANGADAPFGYLGATASQGPWEGVFVKGGVGPVADYIGPAVPNVDYSASMKTYAVVCHTGSGVAPFVDAYINGAFVAESTVDTGTFGADGAGNFRLLKTFFPNGFMSSDFQLGQVAIFNRLLTAGEITSYHNYAAATWYA
jgi:hypothetical protein